MMNNTDPTTHIVAFSKLLEWFDPYFVVPIVFGHTK
jgi:hypothetical protein